MAGLVYVLNGPNLDLLGISEPELYGTETLADLEERCERHAAALDLEVVFRQTNHEGVLVDWVHEARSAGAGVIINAAGLTFTSIALCDALKLVEPLIEIHITNIHQRDYPRSLIAPIAQAAICGLGQAGYALALAAMARLLET